MAQIDFPFALHSTVTVLGTSIRGEVRGLSVDSDGFQQARVRFIQAGQAPAADWFDVRDLQAVATAAPALRTEDATVSFDQASPQPTATNEASQGIWHRITKIAVHAPTAAKVPEYEKALQRIEATDGRHLGSVPDSFARATWRNVTRVDSIDGTIGIGLDGQLGPVRYCLPIVHAREMADCILSSIDDHRRRTNSHSTKSMGSPHFDGSTPLDGKGE